MWRDRCEGDTYQQLHSIRNTPPSPIYLYTDRIKYYVEAFVSSDQFFFSWKMRLCYTALAMLVQMLPSKMRHVIFIETAELGNDFQSNISIIEKKTLPVSHSRHVTKNVLICEFVETLGFLMVIVSLQKNNACPTYFT